MYRIACVHEPLVGVAPKGAIACRRGSSCYRAPRLAVAERVHADEEFVAGQAVLQEQAGVPEMARLIDGDNDAGDLGRAGRPGETIPT
jgi:hypothetical protein